MGVKAKSRQRKTFIRVDNKSNSNNLAELSQNSQLISKSIITRTNLCSNRQSFRLFGNPEDSTVQCSRVSEDNLFRQTLWCLPGEADTVWWATGDLFVCYSILNQIIKFKNLFKVVE